jgi:uncharacterized protein (DUF302 family)
MDESTYGIGIETTLGVADAEHAIRSALSAEGFGVLTEIDVAATLRTKLGLERRPYRILGACNPHLASRALEVDEHIGLLLPCNVIVYETDTGSRIEAMEPAIMARLTSDPRMGPIAAEARERLVRALESLAG